MNFTESRLLDKVAYGSQFGHRYKTRIKELKSGRERRNAEWSLPLKRGHVRYMNVLEPDHGLVIRAHHACMGALVGFRFKDWSDYKAVGEFVGTGAGVAQDVQLQKTYTFGTASQTKPLRKIVFGTVQMYADGSPVSSAVDINTGIATVTVPLDSILTWDGEFDTPVRFESDEISFSADNRSGVMLMLNADVGVVEIRE